VGLLVLLGAFWVHDRFYAEQRLMSRAAAKPLKTRAEPV